MLNESNFQLIHSGDTKHLIELSNQQIVKTMINLRENYNDDNVILYVCTQINGRECCIAQEAPEI